MISLLKRFVPVRITNFKDVDMNRFKFDYDLTFAVLMMDADGKTYSRFGTQDYRSGTERMSIRGLTFAMQAVLDEHEKAEKARPKVAPSGLRVQYKLANIPAFAKSKQANEPCAHCHFANDFTFRELREQGRFARDMLFQYPLPENIGITLEVDRNNVVKSVIPGSPAAKADVRSGDVIRQAGSDPVFSSADLQYSLNTLPEPGEAYLKLDRPGTVNLWAKVELPKGWRKTDISWRASQGGISPTVGFWGEPLKPEQKRARGIGEDRLGLRVTFLFPGDVWAQSRGGLRQEDVITGIDGKALPAMTTRQFHSHFRLNYNVGDTVTLNVLRGNQKVELKVPCIQGPEE